MTDSHSSKIDLRILALWPTAKDFQLMSGILSRAGIESVACSDLSVVCRKMTDGVGAILIAEEALGGVAGDDELSRCLGDQPQWSDIPVLVLAKAGAVSTHVVAAMERFGTVAVLERPIRIVSLVSTVRTALQARRRQYQVRDHSNALEAARDELEDRVTERTAELAEVNLSLQRESAEREKVQEERLVLLKQILTVQEDERKRIARDMQDHFGQQLTAMRLNLDAIVKAAGRNAPVKEKLDETQRLAESLDADVNFLVWELRPTALDDLGIKAAVEQYVRKWSEKYKIPADFYGDKFDDSELSAGAATSLYRIAQEALTNVSKHSHAAMANVVIEKRSDKVVLIVEDDGRGFNDSTRKHNRLGLKGMFERAELAGGAIEIESSLGCGTTIYATVPIAAKGRPKGVNAISK